jgi:hypothetical protein
LLGIANGFINFEMALLEAIVGHHFDRAFDYCAFLQAAIGEFGDHQLKHGVVSVDRVDVCFDFLGVGIIFSPALRLQQPSFLLVGFLLFQKIYDKTQTYRLKHYEQMDA